MIELFDDYYVALTEADISAPTMVVVVVEDRSERSFLYQDFGNTKCWNLKVSP